MQIKALKVYCDVVTLHSFSQAAELNDITQSTASQSVNRLEEHLGAELIDRSVRPWKVTGTGRRCYDYCRDVLNAYDRLEREISSSQRNIRSKVRIGSIYSVGFSYMNQCTKNYSMVNMTDELYVEYLHPEEIINRILDDELDLGIVSYPPNRRDLGVIHFVEEELVVVCSPQHDLAQFHHISPAQLNGQDFVGFDQGLRISRKIKHALRAREVTQRVRMRFDNIEAIKRAVEESNYLAILPRPTLERELLIGTLCARSLTGSALARPLGVVYKKRRPLTSALQKFIDILQDVAETTRLGTQ